MLPEQFVPGDFDVSFESLVFGQHHHVHIAHPLVMLIPQVICAKGKAAANHVGNKRFRQIVRFHLQKYSNASSKSDKSRIVSSIVDTIRQASQEGGFVKYDTQTGAWYEVGDHLAREKVGQTLRDALHTKYSSSTKAKKHRRQAEKARASWTYDSESDASSDCVEPQTFISYREATSSGSSDDSSLDSRQTDAENDEVSSKQDKFTETLMQLHDDRLLDIFFDDRHVEVLMKHEDILDDVQVSPVSVYSSFTPLNPRARASV